MGSNLVGKGKPAGEAEASTPKRTEGLFSLSQMKPEQKKGEFGLQVAKLRILMGQTQDSLARMLLTTRQSIVALEKCNSIEELSDGMLFRMYYLSKELSENKFVPKEITILSEEVLTLTTGCIVENSYR